MKGSARELLRGRWGRKGRPRLSQDAPRRAPGPPKRPPGPPPDAPRSPPGALLTTQNVFRSIWPNNLFRKNLKLRNRQKKVKKKSKKSHPQWLPALVLTKTKSTFKTVEHRGWRRWSREALFNSLFNDRVCAYVSQ